MHLSFTTAICPFKKQFAQKLIEEQLWKLSLSDGLFRWLPQLLQMLMHTFITDGLHYQYYLLAIAKIIIGKLPATRRVWVIIG